MKAGVLFVFLLGLAAVRLHAAAEVNKPVPIKNESLERMIGKWEGKGTKAFGEVRSNMEYKWVMNGQFVQLTYKAESADKKFKLEAIAYMKPIGRDGSCVMHWFDDFGNIAVMNATFTEKGILLTWKEMVRGQMTEFKTEAVAGEKDYNSTDYMKKDDEWIEVGKETFTKK
jgi:hypothetical protein